MRRFLLPGLLLCAAACGGEDPARPSDAGRSPAAGPTVVIPPPPVETPPPPPVAIPDLPVDDPVAIALILCDPPQGPRRPPTAAETAAADRALALLGLRRPAEASKAISGAAADDGRAALVRALLAAGRADWEAFAVEVEAGLRAGVEPEPARAVAGRVLAMLGRYDAAEDALAESRSADALAVLALVRLARGAPAEEALAAADRARAADPESAEAARAGLLVLLAHHRLDEAEKALDSLPRDDPARFEAEGTIRARAGDRPGAIESFTAALELDPGSVAAHRNLAGLLLAEGEEEEGLRHLEAALATSGRPGDFLRIAPDGGPPDVLTKGAGVARGYRALALRRLAEADPDPARVRALLEQAVRADPSATAGWRLLAAHVDRTAGAGEAAALLEEGVRAVGREEAVGLRIATVALRLRAGDAEGAGKAAAGISASALESGFLARAGGVPADVPASDGDAPRTRIATGTDRYSALAEALFGGREEIADRSAFRARLVGGGLVPRLGTPGPAPGERLLVETLVATDRGVRTRFLLVGGPVPGASARFLDEPDPELDLLLPDGLLAGAIAWRPEGAEGADGAALVEALTRIEAGEAREALAALPDGAEHPVAAFVAVRANPTDRTVLDRAVASGPALPELALLLAEAHLALGEIPEALAAANRAEAGGLPPGAGLFVARARALARFGPGAAEEGFAALEALRAAHPGYLPVYEDLAGNYLLRARWRDALEVLRDLGARSPPIRKQPGWLAALRSAENGLARSATVRDEFALLLRAMHADARKLAVRGAARLAYRDACEVLGAFAKDPDAAVRAAAVLAIGQRNYGDALHAVRAAAEDPDRTVRGAVVRSLRLLLGLEGAREIVPFLHDPEAYVREVAVNELRAVSGREYGFDPAAPAAERREQARRWETWAKGR